MHAVYKKQDTLINETCFSPGLAVEWTFGQVYWTDKDEGTISVMDSSGKYNTLIISGLSSPTALLVDPVNSL